MSLRLFTIAVCLLLATCLAAWVRSYVPGELIVRTDRGSLIFMVAHSQWAQAESQDPASFIDRLRSGDPRDPPKDWRFLGFEFFRLSYSPVRYGYFAIGIPFWAICLPLAVGAAWGIARWRRQRDWKSGGKCRKCGYDLRESPDRCPECGAAVVRSASANPPGA